MNKLQPTPGTVIHGTMRTQDLIPEFLRAYRDLDPDGWLKFLSSHCDAPAHRSWAYKWATGEVELPSDDHVWWGLNEAQEWLEDLFQSLNSLAPPGYYFGSHPGDGSDYGFWENEDE